MMPSDIVEQSATSQEGSMKAGRELDALYCGEGDGAHAPRDESYVAEGVGKVLRFVWERWVWD